MASGRWSVLTLSLMTASVAGVGCGARRVSPDGADASDAADTASDTSQPPVVVSFRVVDTTFRVPSPGTGFAFRIESERSPQIAQEGETDASGSAAVTLDAASAPWDLTIARATYASVSLLGLTGPVADPIAVSVMEPQVDPHTTLYGLTGVVTDPNPLSGRRTVAASGEGVGDGAGGLAPPFNYAGGFYLADDGTPTQLAFGVLEFSGNATSLVLINRARFEATPRHAQPVMFSLAMPSPAIAPTTTQISVVLAASGVSSASALTGGSFLARTPRHAWPSGYNPSVAGTASLTLEPGSTDTLDWTIQSYPDVATPTFAQGHVTWPTSPGTPEPYAMVVTAFHFDAGTVMRLPVANALSVSGDTTADVQLAVDAPAFDHAAFEVQTVGSVWWGYQVDGGVMHRHGLPQLPVGAVFPSPDGTPPTTAAVLVHALAVDPGGVPPWAPWNGGSVTCDLSTPTNALTVQ